MPNPTRDTAAGRIYNDLRNLARRRGAPTDQVMLEYLLERFLYRVSIHPLGRQHFVLKGGLLLAQFGALRVTRDIDLRRPAGEPVRPPGPGRRRVAGWRSANCRAIRPADHRPRPGSRRARSLRW